MSELIKTALHAWHVAHGARMVDFASWSMPVQYTSIVAEHHAVRRAAGLFDIAHMGRLVFRGPDRIRLLDHLLTNDVAGLARGQVRYALVCNEKGGVLDDVLVYRFEDEHLLVVNASNRDKILRWIDAQRDGFDFDVTDRTRDSFMAALQGPRARDILAPLTSVALDDLAYYYAARGEVAETPALVSRTGYTGEDGFEVVVPAERGAALWGAILDAGRQAGLKPAGLGARDTLRLEAAMPLYGHELTEEIDPFQAGLAFAVKLNKSGFVGRAALVARKADPTRLRRVGLVLEGRRIARENFTVLAAGQPVGHVTSGTFSPTLEKSIAMAYVDPSHTALGTRLEVDIRGQRIPADVVPLPFYRRPKKKPSS